MSEFESENYYPKEPNLGQNCQFWILGGLATGCCFPKAELEGRRSCEGVIDDVCLYVKDGREPTSLCEVQRSRIKLNAPIFVDKSYLPPGDTI